MLETRKSKRKPSGGLRSSLRRRDKHLSDLANTPADTVVGEKELRKNYRGKGGNTNTKSYIISKVNFVLDGKTVPAELVTVTKSNANKEHSRRNILTKGAEVKLKYKEKEYSARISSRPGQVGSISAIKI